MIQGTPRGIIKESPKETVNEKETIIGRLKSSVKSMISNFITAGLILAVESLVIWILCKYVFPEFQLTFLKTITALFLIRLVLRTVVGQTGPTGTPGAPGRSGPMGA